MSPFLLNQFVCPCNLFARQRTPLAKLMADIRCDMCLQDNAAWGDNRMCTLECPSRRNLNFQQVRLMLAVGRFPRGLHPNSPLRAEATAMMVRAEAIEREEMRSIVTQVNELQARLRYLQSRAEHWRQWQHALLDEFERDGMTCSERDDAPTQPEAEPPEQ